MPFPIFASSTSPPGTAHGVTRHRPGAIQAGLCRRLARLLWGLVPGVLAACATISPVPSADGPTVAPAVHTPTNLVTVPLNHATWWTRFNDPTLNHLIEQAQATHPDVRSAQAALRQARATRDAAAAARLPSVSVSASAQRARSMGSGGTAAQPSNLFATGLDASWEADLFGQNARALDASEADARAAEWSLAQTHTSLAAEVALAYADWWGYRTRLDIAQHNLDAQAASLQLTRWRAQAGLASALEVAQGSTALAQLGAQVPALQTSQTLALHSLAVLTGRTPTHPATPRPNATPSHPADPPTYLPELTTAHPPTPPTMDSDWGLPADTLRQRPDVQRAAAQVQATWARVGQADAARRPNVSLSGTLGFKALTLGALGGSDALVHALLASLSAPVFDAGAGDAKVRAQQAAYDQSRAAYEAAVRTALKDVADALASLQGDQARLVQLQAAAQSAALADTLARQRHQSGLIDYATVLDTQRTLLTAQDSVASTQTTLLADHVRLFKALGGGWPAHTPHTPEQPTTNTAPAQQPPRHTPPVARP